MSKCISREGEYSEHETDARFACQRCFAFDEDAALAEIDHLRQIIGRCEAKLDRGVRCDLPKGHPSSHESRARGFAVWTNHEAWSPDSGNRPTDKEN